LSDQDLKKVKKAMDKIISKNYPITREEVSREEAKRRIEEIGEPFKLEILDSIKTEPITIYGIGEEWWDLCAGPHVESTGQLPKKAIALQSVAGAYWRGDEKREMLQRIYATAWKDPKQLKAYKKRMEEAKKRDHRVLGKKLDLFSIQVSMFSWKLLYSLSCIPSSQFIDMREFNRRMQEVDWSFGTPKDPQFVVRLKISGKKSTLRRVTILFTLLTLQISTFGRLLDTLIFTRKECLTKWMLRMKCIRSNQ